jgi:hypothetical protein
MCKHPLFLTLFLLSACVQNNAKVNPAATAPATGGWHYYTSIGAIPVPDGYKRVKADEASFAEWLRTISLKKDSLVHLYNGQLKRRQSAQFAIMDIPVGNKDLQQCADAVMRLRAEYFYAQKRFGEIVFTDNEGRSYRWTKGDDRPAFERYLETVFGMCGTASLQKQLKPVASVQSIEPGDVFIKGGFPGHAMIVMDVATNKEGKKIYMLAQSYMPAQEIHVVINPMDVSSCWYEADDQLEQILTPEWTFEKNQLRRW